MHRPHSFPGFESTWVEEGLLTNGSRELAWGLYDYYISWGRAICTRNRLGVRTRAISDL